MCQKLLQTRLMKREETRYIYTQKLYFLTPKIRWYEITQLKHNVQRAFYFMEVKTLYRVIHLLKSDIPFYIETCTYTCWIFKKKVFHNWLLVTNFNTLTYISNFKFLRKMSFLYYMYRGYRIFCKLYWAATQALVSVDWCCEYVNIKVI